MVSSHNSKGLTLLLFKFQHSRSSLMIIIYEYLEINQIICLNNTILEFDQYFLLILLEFGKLNQILGLNTRPLQNLTCLNFLW